MPSWFFSAVFIVGPTLALAQAPPLIRNIDANFTTNTIVADGVISPGEWNGVAAGGDQWRIFRAPNTVFDVDNHRFGVLWDDTNLYILYESGFSGFQTNPLAGNALADINFDAPNINFYLDPNRDGDLNIDSGTGLPANPNNDTFLGVDGYQLSFNTPLGTSISTGADRDGVGFFTEAHVDTPFGDQANWNNGGISTSGAALDSSGIVVAQRNSNTTGGVVEIVIPFADLDALAEISGSGGAPIPTGLNATDGPSAGDVWGFNAGFIGETGPNFLPIWSWHDDPSTSADVFPRWPHGVLTFVIPEPSTVWIIGSFLCTLVSRRRIL